MKSFFSCLSLLACLVSCSKTQVETKTGPKISAVEEKIKVQTDDLQKAQYGCSQYTKLTETTPGVWTCNYGIYTLTFTNLRLYNGLIEGQLHHVTSPALLITGQEVFSPTFTFQFIQCTGSPANVTVSRSSVHFGNFYDFRATAIYYAFYNGGSSNQTEFDLANALEVGITYSVTPTMREVTTYSVQGGIDCTSIKVVAGKFVGIKTGPDVQDNGSNLPPNYEYGIAGMCFQNEQVRWAPTMVE